MKRNTKILLAVFLSLVLLLAAAACKKGEHSVLARDIADCLLEKID